MRIKGLKGFQLGKSKGKAGGKGAPAEDNTASQIAEMEEQMSTRTKGLEATAQQLQELSGAAGGTGEKGAAAGPHGPLGELEVAPDDNGEDIEFDSVIDVAGTPGEVVKVVKMVEGGGPVAAPATGEEEKVKLADATARAAPAEAAAPAKPGGDDSFNNLFSNEEEDENPLANLINALPDVTTEELLDDLKEIKEIIQEWQQS
ncbi:MAG TPA: hypothetical protein VJ377_08395 [Dehalococcoidales bacterium]|nr:hypothetical protein [Dehalococcoidales bacterium]